jgi:hypothetical protein
MASKPLKNTHPIFLAMPSHVAVALFDTLLTELEAAACTALKLSDVLVAAAEACGQRGSQHKSAGSDMSD